MLPPTTQAQFHVSAPLRTSRRKSKTRAQRALPACTAARLDLLALSCMGKVADLSAPPQPFGQRPITF